MPLLPFSGAPFTIPELPSDPASPAAQKTWVLKTSGGGTGGGKLRIIFGLGVPITSASTGGSATYQLSYRTLEGTTVRATLS